jgi:hypothetical protein
MTSLKNLAEEFSYVFFVVNKDKFSSRSRLIKAIEEQEEKCQQLEIINQRLQEKLAQFADRPLSSVARQTQSTAQISVETTFVSDAAVVPRGDAQPTNPVDLCICYYTQTGDQARK